MLQCALADIHEFTITPVCADGEVREVVLSGIEEMALATDRKIWDSKSSASCAEKKATLMEIEACLVRPFAFPIFVTPRKRVRRDAILRSITMSSHNELDEGKGEVVTSCKTGSRWSISDVSGMRTIEKRVEDPRSLQRFVTLFGSDMVLGAGEAE